MLKPLNNTQSTYEEEGGENDPAAPGKGVNDVSL